MSCGFASPCSSSKIIPTAPCLDELEYPCSPSSPPPAYDSLYPSLETSDSESDADREAHQTHSSAPRLWNKHFGRSHGKMKQKRELHDGIFVDECDLNQVMNNNNCLRSSHGVARMKNLHSGSEKYIELPGLTAKQAKDRFIEKHSHYSIHIGNPWKQLHIDAIRSTRTWNYNLLTITENRTISTLESPCTEKTVNDCSGRRRPTDLWRIPVNVPEDLHTRRLKIPGSSITERCCRCEGKGFKLCSKCNGEGDTECCHCYSGFCHMVVHDSHHLTSHHSKTHEPRIHHRIDFCLHCRGEGKSTCCDCEGRSQKTCFRCKGSGYIEKFTQLKVEWRQTIDDCFSEKCDISPDFLKTCLGSRVHETVDCDGTVPELTPEDCLNTEMISASCRLTSRQKFLAETKRVHIRKQKQVVSIIPVYEIEARWKGKRITYWIAGTNQLCYIPRNSNSSKQACCIC